MKNKVDTTTWQNFNISDLFDIKGSKTTSLLELQEYGVGGFPFITTQAANNGTEGFYNFSTEKGGVLTVDSAVLGYCSYQDTDFSASDHVEVLTPKFEMTKNIAMFLVAIMNKEQYRYSYGRKASQERLKSCSIKLPAKNGKPDWDFMEQFIDTHTHNYNFATKPVKNLPTPELKTADWQFYKLDDLFDVKYGVNCELVNLEETTKDEKNSIRLVSRTDTNNGISAFVKMEEKAPNPANTISVASSGSVLATFSQTEEYYSGRDIYYLQPKTKVNNAILLFLITLIRKEKYRYNYGRQANRTLKSLKIKLPTRDNKPDWDFIKNFMETLPFSSQI
ncbi:MAG: restriction endonuclease subunit S [Endomicrobium sp.]|uniref:restriction endonuclease subunit S n=1 Tax=Candidatus Endomicrobiellum pyrsonymphae TaxID=1408203 RepID=UPI003579D389|nr:restriction endonuclease subunit S [Endomicrobium sp.]MCA6072834.1 restriction endonuclease subunit S [Endomicrobium sp.]